MKILKYKACQPVGKGYDFLFEYNDISYTISVRLPNSVDDIPILLAEQFGLSLSPYLFNVEDFDAIELEAMQLTQEQKQFFEWYFVHGLAEHRYTNNIDPRKPIQIICQAPLDSQPATLPEGVKDKYLVMIGGGKDSLVGLEILKRLQKDYTFLAVNANRPSKDVLKVIDQQDNLYNIELTISPPTGKGQKYSGHKPGSSFWAFASVVAAFSSGHGRVVVSNEHSANYAQIEVDGFPINHQFSKSLEFEQRFNDYVNTYLLKNYTYFSILRPLYEIQIAKIFASSLIQKFQHEFISCNVSYRDGRWCEACAKCAFVFTVLAPFVDKEVITEVWSKNLFEEEAICRYVFDLASENVSPLECVGTPYETRIALHIAKTRGLLENAHPAYKAKLEGLAAKVSSTEISGMMKSYEDNCIPADIEDEVRKIILKLLDTV